MKMGKKQIIVEKYGTLKAQGSKKMLLLMICIVGFILILPIVNATIWDDGSLIAYWDMESQTANVNSTSYNLTKRSTTAPSFVSGKVGLASNHSASRYWNITRQTGEINLNRSWQNFTIAFWVYHVSFADGLTQIYLSDRYNEGWSIIKSNDATNNTVNVNDLNGDGTFYAATNLTTGNWYHIAVTKNSSHLCIWINGSMNNCQARTGNVYPKDGPSTFTIGADAGDGSLPLNGSIDEIGIWLRALSPAEITEVYNNNLGYNPLFIENSQTYSQTTTPLATETFIINITYNSSAFSSISGNFFYNGTSYTGTKSGSGNTILYTKTITIPQLSSSTNYTFYWQFNFTNSTGNNLHNSTKNNQTIYITNIDNCSVYSILLINFTMFDEKTQSKITSDINTSIETNLELYPANSNNIILNYSVGTNKSNLSICISNYLANDTNYRLYGITKYYSSNYVIEYHYFQNYTLTNSSIPQHIKLYDLKNSESTEYLTTYYDINYITLEDAIIIINRKYIAEGTFKPVEWIKTDSFGQGKGHFDTSAIYLINVYKEGELLSAFTNLAIFCEDIVTGNCKINLFASAVEDILVDYYIYHNLYYDMSFNMTTRTVTSNFQTVDSSSVTMNLNLTKFDGYGNFSLCSNTVVGSAGTLTCTIPASQTNITFIAEIKKDGELITTAIYRIYPTTTAIFGDNSVIFVLGLVITIPLMFIPSMYGVLIGAGIGFILGIELLNLSPNIFGGAAFLTWLMIVIFIIIWKVQSRRAE